MREARLSMTTTSPTAGTADSRAALLALLAAVRRGARFWIWAESLAVGVAVAVAGGWVMFVADRLVEPPAWVRGTILVGLTALLAWTIATRLLVRLAVPLTDEALALVVERTHPALGDSLSTAVSCGRGGDAVDPGLFAATVSAAAAGLDRVRVADVFRGRRLRGTIAAAAVAVAVTAAAAAARPADAATFARRIFGLSAAPWPRRVTLEPEGFVEGRRVVARGDDVEVVVRATAASGRPPELVELRTHAAGGVRVERMGIRGGPTAAGRSFGHVLEGVAEDLELEIRGGDARLRGLRIAVEDPPQVASLELAVLPPSYLGGGLRPAAVSRVVPVPRGAVVSLTVTASKPLSAAVVAVRAAADADGRVSEERPIARLEPAAAGTATISARTPVIDADTAVIVRLVDGHGLVNRDPVAVMLAAVPDEPPRVAVRLAGISSAVTPAAVLPIEGVIDDDHGLASADVRLTPEGGTRIVPIPRVGGGVAAVEFPPDDPEVVRLEPLGLAVGGRLEVTVAARDQCGLDGDPQETVGETWSLEVVSPEALRALVEAREVLLRRRIETVIDDLAKARDRVAGDAPPERGAAALAWCEETVARAGGETAEIAGEFRGIHRELVNNGLASPDLEARLLGQIAGPLAVIATEDLAAVRRLCRAAPAAVNPPAVAAAIEAAVVRLRAVVERMLELESVNEVIERLRGVIRLQEEVRSDTLDRQRRRGREALESP